jgi:hypothetical protein
MTDPRLTGKRCHAARRIVHHKGIVDRDTPGTVRCAMENIGRTLFEVEFDSGQSLTVLADYIAFEDDRSAA